METIDFSKFEMKELSSAEAQLIYGGESAWYWVAYGIGAIGRGLAAVFSSNSLEAYGNAQLAGGNMN